MICQVQMVLDLALRMFDNCTIVNTRTSYDHKQNVMYMKCVHFSMMISLMIPRQQ